MGPRQTRRLPFVPAWKHSMFDWPFGQVAAAQGKVEDLAAAAGVITEATRRALGSTWVQVGIAHLQVGRFWEHVRGLDITQ